MTYMQCIQPGIQKPGILRCLSFGSPRSPNVHSLHTHVTEPECMFSTKHELLSASTSSALDLNIIICPRAARGCSGRCHLPRHLFSTDHRSPITVSISISIRLTPANSNEGWWSTNEPPGRQRRRGLACAQPRPHPTPGPQKPRQSAQNCLPRDLRQSLPA